MFCRGEDAACVVDADGGVGRGVEDEQRLAQRPEARGEILFSDIVEKSFADAKGASAERDLDLALGADLCDAVLEQAGDMGGIGRRVDRHHGARLRDVAGDCKDGGAASCGL